MFVTLWLRNPRMNTRVQPTIKNAMRIIVFWYSSICLYLLTGYLLNITVFTRYFYRSYRWIQYMYNTGCTWIITLILFLHTLITHTKITQRDMHEIYWIIIIIVVTQDVAATSDGIWFDKCIGLRTSNQSLCHITL